MYSRGLGNHLHYFVCAMVTLSAKRFFEQYNILYYPMVKIAPHYQIVEIKIAYTLAPENVQDALTTLYYF